MKTAWKDFQISMPEKDFIFMNCSLNLETSSMSEISKDKKQFSEQGGKLREVIVYFRLWLYYIFEYRIFVFKKHSFSDTAWEK